MFAIILMMRRNFILGFLRHLLGSNSGITKTNLLIKSVGVALNRQNMYGN